jgi:hypothetical protein
MVLQPHFRLRAHKSLKDEKEKDYTKHKKHYVEEEIMRVRSTQRVQPDEGVHFARIVGLADIGHQPGFTWSGGEVDSSYKYEITYELVNTEMDDGSDYADRPFWVSEEVTNTDSDKGKLKQRLQAVGLPFVQVESMVGEPVMVTIEHNDKGYAKIVNVAGVPTGTEVRELRNQAVIFDIYDESPDVEQFKSFSEFKQKKIQDALDFKTTPLFKALYEDGYFDEDADDAPF